MSRAILLRDIPLETWQRALERAQAEGHTLAAILLDLLTRYACGRRKLPTPTTHAPMTPAERTARATKAAAARWRKATPEARIAQGQTANAGRQKMLKRRAKRQALAKAWKARERAEKRARVEAVVGPPPKPKRKYRPRGPRLTPEEKAEQAAEARQRMAAELATRALTLLQEAADEQADDDDQDG